MEYSLKKQGQAVVAYLKGEFDLNVAPEFRKEISALLKQEPLIKHLVFQVRDLKFIDSSGLGVILGRYRELQTQGGKLFFVQANPQIKRVLQVSGLLKIGEFVDSLEEVLQKIGGEVNA